jgi:hypothetical protein
MIKCVKCRREVDLDDCDISPMMGKIGAGGWVPLMPGDIGIEPLSYRDVATCHSCCKENREALLMENHRKIWDHLP